MVLLAATQISKVFGDKEVLRATDLEIRSGDHIAIVGPNGAGKTTLLKILTGQMQSDSGTVSMPTSGSIGYLEQHPQFADGVTVWSLAKEAVGNVATLATEAEAIAKQLSDVEDPIARETLMERYDRLQAKLHQEDAYNWEHRVERILQGLGFDRNWFERTANTLSGGQQNRLMLACLLLQQPDLMILDEPNNHLDIESSEWLESTLANWPGAYLLVSHDRFFLDQTSNVVLELVDGKLDRFRGNYSAYVTQKSERLEVARRTFEKQKEEVEKLEEFIRKHHYGQKSTQAEDRRKKLERIELVEPPREIHTPRFQFGKATRTGDIVLRATGLSKSYDHLLFEKLNLQVERGERWAILGSNGSGKSTLLKCLLNVIEPDSGEVTLGTNLRIGYFDQQLGQLDAEVCAAEAIRVAHRDLDDKARRDILGAYGLSGDIVRKPLRMLSGGERNRVMLAWLSAMEANVLILDEPTNHLDLWSRQALEKAIRDFDGTVLLVTHDRYLVNAVADHVLVIGRGKTSQLAGNYDDYKHWIKEGLAVADRGKGVALSTKGTGAEKPGSTAHGSLLQSAVKPEKRKRKYPYRKTDELERDIEKVESALENLHSRVLDPAVLRDGRQMKELHQQIGEQEAKLEQLYDHYEEACELN